MKMKPIILVGSTYFFKDFPDFKSKDTDEIELMEYAQDFKDMQQLYFPKEHRDLFRYIRKPVDEMIAYDIKCNCPMQVGKYLVPKFADVVGFTIEDLPKLKPLIDTLDEKHLYEKSIFESYIENKSFTLSDEQLKKAYEIYKKYRKC